VAGFADCKPDPAMLARARRGDMKAHEVLYASYGGPVYTLAARILADPALAEEVLQDTCIEVIRHVAEFRNDAAFGGWVKRIATNKALAHLRSAWHRKSESLSPDETRRAGLGTGRPGRSGGAAADRESLEGAGGLPPTARAVVWLYDVEGYSHQEIAALMGKTVSFSKSRLSRAHEQLRARAGPDYEEVNGMHATTEQLLSLRDGQPVDAAPPPTWPVRACQREARALSRMRARLRACRSWRRRGDLWRVVAVNAVAGPPAAAGQWPQVAGLAAGLVLGVALVVSLTHAGRGAGARHDHRPDRGSRPRPQARSTA
jgi:RNA polymerase sigma factor (sigma-70 family)